MVLAVSTTGWLLMVAGLVYRSARPCQDCLACRLAERSFA